MRAAWSRASSCARIGGQDRLLRSRFRLHLHRHRRPPSHRVRLKPLGTGVKFQARIDEAARTLAANPRFKNLTPKYLQGLVEFVSGNMLFVLLHELGHAAITEMRLPVLGRMEDAADTFAALRLIRIRSDFSHRVLTEAAKGWFLADLRDQRAGDKVPFYDEHGLNQQRAYQIVCLMVGSDEEKFKDLAKETKLPESRQESCASDYSNAVYSWDLLLKPHQSPPNRPIPEIDAIYGPADGRAAIAQQMARSVRLLQAVTERVANAYVWPVSFTLEMQSCGFPNARWDLSTHKLVVCYELAADFASPFGWGFYPYGWGGYYGGYYGPRRVYVGHGYVGHGYVGGAVRGNSGHSEGFHNSGGFGGSHGGGGHR